MKRILASLVLGCTLIATPSVALAQSKAIVFQSLGAPVCSNSSRQYDCYEYLGPAYDPSAVAYRLKFMRNSRVTFVDIDARTGRVLRRSR